MSLRLKSRSGTITFEMVKKIQDAGFCIEEAPVHHYYRQYGLSQFFNFPRVLRTLVDLLGWWWRLVIRKEHLKAGTPAAHPVNEFDRLNDASHLFCLQMRTHWQAENRLSEIFRYGEIAAFASHFCIGF